MNTEFVLKHVKFSFVLSDHRGDVRWSFCKELPSESPANGSPRAAKRQPFLAAPLRAVSKLRLFTLSIYHLCFLRHYHFTCVPVFLFSVKQSSV